MCVQYLNQTSFIFSGDWHKSKGLQKERGLPACPVTTAPALLKILVALTHLCSMRRNPIERLNWQLSIFTNSLCHLVTEAVLHFSPRNCVQHWKRWDCETCSNTKLNIQNASVAVSCTGGKISLLPCPRTWTNALGKVHAHLDSPMFLKGLAAAQPWGLTPPQRTEFWNIPCFF